LNTKKGRTGLIYKKSPKLYYLQYLNISIFIYRLNLLQISNTSSERLKILKILFWFLAINKKFETISIVFQKY